MSPATIRCAKPFRDRRLAHAGLADEDGIVLPPPREDLHDAADLRIAADDGVELSGAGLGREVDAVPLEGAILPFRVLIRDPMRPPDFLHRLARRFRTGPRVPEQRARGGGLLPGEGQEEVLGRHVRIAHIPGERIRRVEDAVEFAAEGRSRPTLFRQAAHGPLEPRLQIGEMDAHRLQDRHDDAALLPEQCREEVYVLDGGVVRPARRERRVVEGFAGLEREPVVRDHLLFSIRAIRGVGVLRIAVSPFHEQSPCPPGRRIRGLDPPERRDNRRSGGDARHRGRRAGATSAGGSVLTPAGPATSVPSVDPAP